MEGKIMWTELDIPGASVFEPIIYSDKRGYFSEVIKVPEGFIPVQVNESESVSNVFRGMHYQKVKPQAKIVRCLRGSITDYILDLKTGKVISVELSESNMKSVLIPKHCAHGFHTVTGAKINYLVDEQYYAEYDSGVFLPNLLNYQGVIMSDKDMKFPVYKVKDFVWIP